MTIDTSTTDYQRIAATIRYLDEHYRDQPSLDELAAQQHMSTYHFQRLFRRWAGISPKRFVQYLTVEHAKQQLAESRSVLDAAYDVDLSGPGRLHDLFVNLEGVTPGEYKRQGMDLAIDYGYHSTPFGECLLAATDRGICFLTFVGDHQPGDGRMQALNTLAAQWPGALLTERSGRTQPLVDLLFPASATTGRREVNLLVKGTNFQIKVWEALLHLPQGTVCSYGDVAALIEKPGAAQAVGQAVGRNSLAYVIPCHRVIRQSGVVSDYRWGATRKKAILAWEAAMTSTESDLVAA